MAKTLTKRLAARELAEILGMYNLKLKKYESLRRRRGTQRIYVLTSSRRKVLLKEYESFPYQVRKSLFLLTFLARRRYPAARVLLSKKDLPFVRYKQRHFALFEFIDFPKETKAKTVSVPNRMQTVYPRRAYEVGKYLGILHATTKKFPFRLKKRGYEHYRRMFFSNYYKRKHAPKKNQKIMDYIREHIDELKAPADLPKGICHVEFVQKHLLFKGDGLYRVIDWDFISRDTLFYDLGTASIVAFSFYKKKLRFSFKVLANMINGYNRYRKLTKWEKDHIYEAVLYGAFKYAIWDIPGEAWERRTFDLVGELMKYDMESFNEKFRKVLK